MSKKLKVIAYCVLIVLILIVGYLIYSKLESNNSGKDLNDKVNSEIRYLESEITTISNKLNNIYMLNYKVATSTIPKGENSESDTGSSNGSNSGSQSGSGSSQGSGEGSGSNSEQGKINSTSQNANTTKSTETTKEYNLKSEGVLEENGQESIDWNEIQMKVENLYTSIYTITLDLYQTNSNQEDILNFNKNLDNVTKAVKDKDKEKSLQELVNLYSYLPKFSSNIQMDNIYYAILQTKEQVLRAYSILDLTKWDEMENDINNAIESYSVLLQEVNQDDKQFSINKLYIVLNELKNSCKEKNRDVFLIKYKNLLEQIKSL